jgi:hypothetical protein
LLFIALLLFLAVSQPRAFGQAGPKPSLLSPGAWSPDIWPFVQFQNDIFSFNWWLSVPNDFVDNAFNQTWWSNVQIHFFDVIFNDSWWLGFRPSPTLFQPIIDHDAAQRVIAEINALPAKSALAVTDAPAVSAARADYAALTPAQKALVTNYATLTTDNAQITSLQAAKTKAAAAANQNPAAVQPPNPALAAPVYVPPSPPPLPPSPPTRPAYRPSTQCTVSECKFNVYCTTFGQGGCWQCNCSSCVANPAIYQTCN